MLPVSNASESRLARRSFSHERMHSPNLATLSAALLSLGPHSTYPLNVTLGEIEPNEKASHWLVDRQTYGRSRKVVALSEDRPWSVVIGHTDEYGHFCTSICAQSPGGTGHKVHVSPPSPLLSMYGMGSGKDWDVTWFLTAKELERR